MDDLVAKATEFSAKGEGWHYHFLTRNCMYNAMGRQFQLILENEEDGNSFVAVSYERPEKWLKALGGLNGKNGK